MVFLHDSQGNSLLVVEEVVKKLKTKQKSTWIEHLIGIDDQVVAVNNLLDVGSGGGRLIQIHGMGGIGKTTLAKVVFNELSTHFGKCCCFLEDVREKSSRTDGLVGLQNKLLSEIGNAAGTRNIDAIDDGMKRIEDTLRHKKVLIVLDDVDKSEQVEKLVGKCALFSGSRVLITTRNEDVLQISGPKYEILRYEMKVMSSDHAFQLFSRHAFNSDSPQEDDCVISKKIVSATGRLPLTIVVIGSLLKNKTQELWKEKLDELRKAPPQGVFQVLKVSYDALTFEQQQIFLDIACFFIGEEKTNAIYMWQDCKLFPLFGIEVLKNKSLIKIGKHNEFLMHDQLRDLGRGIVHNENPMNPEERSRLWIKDEVLDTIKTKKMKNVEAMELDLLNEQVFKSEEIGRFEKLRFLKLGGGTFVGDLMDCFPKLRWIDWRRAFDLKSELTNMCLKNVVVLQFSSIASLDDMKLGSLIKETRKLKVLELSWCRHITTTQDLSGCSTLERLTFQNCRGLKTIDSSIGKLKHLIELTVDECLIELTVDECYLLGLPEEIGDLQNLERFILRVRHEMKELPDSIFKWKSLRELELSSGGSTEESVPSRGNANLKGQLPSEIGLLSQLQRLVLRDLYEIRELPALPISLTHLEVFSMSLQVVPDLSNLTNLVELDLYGGFEYGKQDIIHTGESRWIGKLSKLEQLRLCFLHVPAPIELASLHRLSQLHLSNLNLQPFIQVPSSLLKLELEKFNPITLLSSNLKNLSNLMLRRPQVEEIILNGLQLPNLSELYVTDEGGPLERFILSGMKMLERVTMWNCPKLDEIHIAGVLESLEFLHIDWCESFKRFMYVEIRGKSSHESSLILESRVFNKLQYLGLKENHKILDIQFVGMSESLEHLVLYGDHLQSLRGLSNLKNLKSLELEFCPELRIVEGLDKLKFLNELGLIRCRLLESQIDVLTSELPNDCNIYRFPKIPKDGEGLRITLVDVEFLPSTLFSHAESSAQEQMHVPGKTEELLAPFEEPQEPSSHGTCTCFGGLFCFKDH
ncbi:disease resistance protein RPV1 isoform X2 [Eucalyptus grandis]|uniref:disease resistance protein RPV1 isoform X2 n=1 Tax=Eucalyptus grandis TaxID=71139 RepID=UPI00192EEBC7|nr:disease resistance protein RPV1 isoform X2 [Eucalyptus grandis]